MDFDVHISLWINSDTRLSRDIVLSLSALLNSDTKTNYKSGNSINGSDRTRKDTQVNSHVFVIDMDKLAAVAESVSNSAEDSGIDVFLYVNLVHR